MDIVFDPVAGLTLWHWLALGAILVALEIITPTTYLLWPGLAALVMGALTAIVPDLSWQVQLLIYAVLAVAVSLAGRKFMPKPGDIVETSRLNRRADQYVGRRALAAENFVAGRGPVTIDDTRWPAQTLDGSSPAKGATVEVKAADGMLLKVTPV